MTLLTPERLRPLVELAIERDLLEFDVNQNLFTDYDMDSMSAVVLVIEIQRATRIRIPEEVAETLMTGQDYIEYVNSELRRLGQG